MSMKHFFKTVFAALTAFVCISSVVTPPAASGISALPRLDGVTPRNVADTESEVEHIYETVPVDSFRVSDLSPKTDTDMDYTDWWYSPWEDCRYVFLPATADRTKLVIEYSSKEPLTLNGKEIKSGAATDVLADADEFTVKMGKTDCGKLKVMQSELGCFYLSVKPDGLDALDGNRWLEESGTALMLDADGSTEYYGEIEKFEAHGNSSWDYSQKKPYHFKLANKADLYGMGKAKKWVLISNYIDHSMLRNKLAEEICHAADMKYAVDSTFVDLYADGSYRGT